MNKVQFFSDSDIASLQESINTWLADNEAIDIIQTNSSSLVKPDLLGNMQSIENHIFYILYRVTKIRKKKGYAAMEEIVTVNSIQGIQAEPLPPPL